MLLMDKIIFIVKIFENFFENVEKNKTQKMKQRQRSFQAKIKDKWGSIQFKLLTTNSPQLCRFSNIYHFYYSDFVCHYFL